MYRLVATTSLISLLSTTITAISLADFKPKIPALPARCETVYRYPVKECVPEDFQGDNACSDRCQGAIQALVPYVDRECAGVRVGADTIIGIFLAGNGVDRLCPNVRSPAPAPAPAPILPPPSEENPRGPSRGQSPSQDSLRDGDNVSMEFAPTLGPSDEPSSTLNRAGSTATSTDDDIRGSRPTRTASGDSADTTDEGDGEDDGEDDDDDDDGDDGDDGGGGGGGGGSPFDDEGGNGAISSYKPNVLCLMALLAAFGIFNIT